LPKVCAAKQSTIGRLNKKQQAERSNLLIEFERAVSCKKQNYATEKPDAKGLPLTQARNQRAAGLPFRH